MRTVISIVARALGGLVGLGTAASVVGRIVFERQLAAEIDALLADARPAASGLGQRRRPRRARHREGPVDRGQRRHRHLHHPAQTVPPVSKGAAAVGDHQGRRRLLHPGIRALPWIAKASEGPAQYPTKSDPVRPQEDAGFLPRPDAADRARC